MVQKWKKQARQLESKGVHVYVLSLEEWNHGAHYGRGESDTELLGLFDSKEAAVAAATKTSTDYGTFDEAIKDTFCEEGDYIDKRENPPDNARSFHRDRSRRLVSQTTSRFVAHHKQRSIQRHSTARPPSE